MVREWTFGQRLGFGFVITALLTLTTGALTVWALHSVVASKDEVIDVSVRGLSASQELRVAVEAKSSAGRAYLLTGDQRYSARIATARTEFNTAAGRIREVLENTGERNLLDQVVAGEQRHQDVLQNVMVRRDQPGVDLS